MTTDSGKIVLSDGSMSYRSAKASIIATQEDIARLEALINERLPHVEMIAGELVEGPALATKKDFDRLEQKVDRVMKVLGITIITQQITIDAKALADVLGGTS